MADCRRYEYLIGSLFITVAVNQCQFKDKHIKCSNRRGGGHKDRRITQNKAKNKYLKVGRCFVGQPV